MFKLRILVCAVLGGGAILFLSHYIILPKLGTITGSNVVNKEITDMSKDMLHGEDQKAKDFYKSKEEQLDNMYQDLEQNIDDITGGLKNMTSSP